MIFNISSIDFFLIKIFAMRTNCLDLNPMIFDDMTLGIIFISMSQPLCDKVKNNISMP